MISPSHTIPPAVEQRGRGGTDAGPAVDQVHGQVDRRPRGTCDQHRDESQTDLADRGRSAVDTARIGDDQCDEEAAEDRGQEPDRPGQELLGHHEVRTDRDEQHQDDGGASLPMGLTGLVLAGRTVCAHLSSPGQPRRESLPSPASRTTQAPPRRRVRPRAGRGRAQRLEARPARSCPTHGESLPRLKGGGVSDHGARIDVAPVAASRGVGGPQLVDSQTVTRDLEDRESLGAGRRLLPRDGGCDDRRGERPVHGRLPLSGGARLRSNTSSMPPRVARRLGDGFTGVMASGEVESALGAPPLTEPRSTSGELVPVAHPTPPGGDDAGIRAGDVDGWGRSERMRALARRLYDPVYRRWFRVEWEGLEHIPRRAARCSSATTPARSRPTRR